VHVRGQGAQDLPDRVFGAARTLSSDGRVTRTDTSPTGRFAVVWQRKSYPYTIKAAFGT
jgi:hypothetical protein